MRHTAEILECLSELLPVRVTAFSLTSDISTFSCTCWDNGSYEWKHAVLGKCASWGRIPSLCHNKKRHNLPQRACPGTGYKLSAGLSLRLVLPITNWMDDKFGKRLPPFSDVTNVPCSLSCAFSTMYRKAPALNCIWPPSWATFYLHKMISNCKDFHAHSAARESAFCLLLSGPVVFTVYCYEKWILGNKL